MQCPIDGETLVMSDRHGVEIDYCPKCRGVWLDRGELDKIIERAGVPAAAAAQASAVSASAPPRVAYAADPRAHHYDDDDDRYRHGKRKKREGFLGELFDF